MTNTDLSTTILGLLEDDRWRDDVDADWFEDSIRKAIAADRLPPVVATVHIDPADIVSVPKVQEEAPEPLLMSSIRRMAERDPQRHIRIEGGSGTTVAGFVREVDEWIAALKNGAPAEEVEPDSELLARETPVRYEGPIEACVGLSGRVLSAGGDGVGYTVELRKGPSNFYTLSGVPRTALVTIDKNGESNE